MGLDESWGFGGLGVGLLREGRGRGGGGGKRCVCCLCFNTSCVPSGQAPSNETSLGHKFVCTQTP